MFADVVWEEKRLLIHVPDHRCGKETEVNCKTRRKVCDKRNCEQNGFPVKDFESMV